MSSSVRRFCADWACRTAAPAATAATSARSTRVVIQGGYIARPEGGQLDAARRRLHVDSAGASFKPDIVHARAGTDISRGGPHRHRVQILADPRKGGGSVRLRAVSGVERTATSEL